MFLAYRYLLSSSGESEVEHSQEQNVVEKQAQMSSKASSSGTIPANVLNKIDDVSVLEKEAKLSVRGNVRLQSINDFNGIAANMLD